MDSNIDFMTKFKLETLRHHVFMLNFNYIVKKKNLKSTLILNKNKIVIIIIIKKHLHLIIYSWCRL